MNAYKTMIAVVLFLILAMPVQVVVAQMTEPDVSQVDETDPGTEKTTTEKKKSKKEIEIDAHFFISLGIDIVAICLIILLVYYPNYRKLDNIFTLVIFNLVIFLLTFVMKYVKLSMGAAFGLFAVFTMLRYRTAGISMKDMTYLFIFIAIGVISSIQLELSQLLIINGLIVAGTFIMDGKYIIRREMWKNVMYENIDLIQPERRADLISDLRNRTGLNIHRITIEKINFLKDTATIRIYYYE